jgi:HNH endonuclease/AP2 domain
LPELSDISKGFPPIERLEGLTQEYLKEILHYEPETGLWFWFRDNSGKLAGQIHNGYVLITIDGVKYLAHRLAFLYMTGKWPENDVDHKDNIRNNNEWSNLRDCTHSQNMHNKPISKRNSSGAKGVSYSKVTKKYRATIALGTFNTLEEARVAYENAAKKLHGEFYRA